MMNLSCFFCWYFLASDFKRGILGVCLLECFPRPVPSLKTTNKTRGTAMRLPHITLECTDSKPTYRCCTKFYWMVDIASPLQVAHSVEASGPVNCTLQLESIP